MASFGVTNGVIQLGHILLLPAGGCLHCRRGWAWQPSCTNVAASWTGEERTARSVATVATGRAVLPWEADRRGRPGGSYPRSTLAVRP